ncbi:MAG: hypothetical protein N3F03_01980 [Ignavibacteria bacterium]|nr:hypothetical protein [Ignavibacteria bacterium]
MEKQLDANMTEEEKIVYGFGETTRIVAIQQISSKEMRLYTRIDNKVNHIERKFYPFFFAINDKILPTFDGKFWKKKLTGNEYYQYIFAFETWSDMYKALRLIAKNLKREFIPRQKMDEIYIIYEPITQFLLQTGETLFKGMNYEELKIIYLKVLPIIEKDGRYHSKYFDQVFAISISDNEGWSNVLYQKSKSIKEKDLLQHLVEIIQKKNPDLIIGYNLFEELIYLNTRYKVYNLPFAIGRDGSEPLFEMVNKPNLNEKKVHTVLISGRHTIDLLSYISQSRTILRDVENYSIPVISKYFGIKYPQESVIDESKIPLYADVDQKKLIDKIVAENEVISKLSDIIIPQYFYQSQFVPMDFVQAINSGVASKIELMMVREYLRKRHSLPKANPRQSILGGYTEIFYRGLFDNVIYADVESLYPSIIIQNKIYPDKDKLKVFLKLVTILTKERIRLKRLKEDTGDPYLKMHYDRMQNAYKILINSFYGYLGFAEGIFNDYKKANEVTLRGQQILKQLINEFQKRNCTVIEVDTDGLFVSPQNVLNEEEEKKLVEEINNTLPETINLSFGGRYKRMLSYKKKNYALLDYDNRLIIKGSALISRGFENYALNFLRQCIELIITDKTNLIPKIYRELVNDIINMKIDIKDLAKTEILRDTYQEYIEAVATGKRQRSAPYELAIKYYDKQFSPGMKITYYITGNDPNPKLFEQCELIDFYNPKNPNLNINYYLRKLEEYVSRFEVFFTKEDFELLFPKESNFTFEIKPKVINTPVKE